MSTNPHFDFSHLTPAERVQLAIDLWDSIDPDEADLPLTDAERAELERCLDEYDADPDAVEDWETIRDEALRELGVSADDPRRGRM
jgi:putative addiction module component (TIGR02574 family)